MKNVIKDLAATTAVSWGSIAEKLDENFRELEDANSGSSGIDERQLEAYLKDHEYAQKKDIPSMPTNVSELNNDAGYITAEDVNIPNVDLSDYATKEELGTKQNTLVSGENIKTINGVSIVGKGNIAIGEGATNATVVELNGDEICDYYAINKSGEHVLATGYGCSSHIDCAGCGSMEITLMQNTSAINYGLAFYDAEKKFISYVASLIGSEKKGVVTTVSIPENAHYFRTSYFNFENQKTCGDFRCVLTYDANLITLDGKRPYQNGFIYFSQRVNQSVTKYWSTDQTIANDGNIKVTTGVLALPTTYSNTGKKTPLILYAHGLSHYVYYGTWGATETFPVQKQHWLDMGFAVMDCNGARDNNRSAQFASGICPQGINAYKLCVEYIQEHYNVSDDIFIVAGSAGGAVGWNFLSQYGKHVKAAVFLSAYSDMKSDAWGAGGQKNRYVEFLGFDNSSTYEVDKTIGFDPALKIVDISGKKYCFDYYNTPIYAIYGSLDTYNLVNSMKNLVTALRNAGATVQIRKIDGVGHEIVSGANIMVDTEVGNWLLSHYRALGEGSEIVYHTVTYKYVDENGTEIKSAVTATVMNGATIDFAGNKASITGYEYVSVNPASATVTSDMTVVYTYKKTANTYTITYEYRDADGETIKESATEVVTEGTSKNFAESYPTIVGYEFASVNPTSAVVNSNMTVVYTYNVAGGSEIEGLDITNLFAFDITSRMVTNTSSNLAPGSSNFQDSSNFMSCFTDLSAYAGKEIRIMLPEYKNSAGKISGGVTLWSTEPTQSASKVYATAKAWDMYDGVSGTGILREHSLIVPEEAPYLWTSTYMDGVAAYVGPNSGLIDFRCYVVEEGGDTPEVKSHTVTYQYKDTEGNVIKEQTTTQVNEGTELNFENVAPTIAGYDYVSVTPTSATITADTTVVFTYQKQDAPIEGNDLSSLFTFDHKSWMCVINPQFKASSYFDSGYTDLSAYVGKTIRITVPQYTASNGSSSTGVTFWTATPTEQPSAFNRNNLIKQWDTHNAGNAKGILVEVETVVPADAPYIWTSTYNDNAVSLGVYVGENDGYTDFKCYIVE